MSGAISELLDGATTSVISVVNGGAATVANASTAFVNANCSTSLSGAMTAGALKTAYSATGAGRINFFGIATQDATSRTIRIKITVNGSTVAYDKTSAAIATASSGVVAVGAAAAGVVQFQSLDYTNGLLIEFASSLTETDKLTVGINAEVRQ